MPIPKQRGHVRGRSCCSNGDVVLPPIKEHPVLREYWRGEEAAARTLQKYARKFNNALALASEMVQEIDAPDGGWQPSVVIQGKLYHKIGPLTADAEHAPAFAQLYVYDPDAVDDVAERRCKYMHLPKQTSGAERARCLDLLKTLQAELRTCNSYVSDFVHAATIFGEEDVTDATFVIEPKAAPKDAGKRTYNAYEAFGEVSVMMVEPTGGKVPKRCVVVRARGGGLQQVDETSRAFDPLHFVLLFPYGDDGWCDGMHKRPAGEPPTVNGHLYDKWDARDGVWRDGSNRPVPRGAAGQTAARTRRVQQAARNAATPREERAARRSATKGKERQLSVRQFYAHRLHQRHQHEEGESLFRAQRLFQEYVCMAFAKQESQRLRYIATHQKEIRADLYQNLKDAVSAHDHRRATGESTDELSVGTRVVLPASFSGGPRDMHRRYQDAMAVVRKKGKPSLFITMTCNPKWPEIVGSLLPGQTPEDRPDVVARVFKMKLDALLAELYKDGILGNTVAHLDVIEFQKRGLPHCHILVILTGDDRIVTADQIDEIVSAELPEPPKREDFPDGDEGRAQFEHASAECQRLEDIIVKTLLHRECGRANPNAPCMVDGVCSKNYPKPFQSTTEWNDAEIYPKYRRRSPAQGGRSFVHETTDRHGKTRSRVVDNGWVVPHNRFLTLKYDCHINVEVCISVESVKYLYKYVYKGPDRTMVRVQARQATQKQQREAAVNRRRGLDGAAGTSAEPPEAEAAQAGVNEIERYQDMRSMGSAESCWRTFDFKMYGKTPPVDALEVHLENLQYTQWAKGTERQVANAGGQDTHLTHWLQYIRAPPADDLACRRFKYADFVEQHAYEKKTGWRLIKLARSEQATPVGRLHTVHPSAGEPFYLRMLLTHLEGSKLDLSNASDAALRAQSFTFTALRCVPDADGVPQLCESYQEACERRGLLLDDKEWAETMQSAQEIVTSMPAFRELFVSILVYNRPSNAAKLFEQFWHSMGDDYKRQLHSKGIEPLPSLLRALVLLDVERRLQSAGEGVSNDEERALEKHRLVLSGADRTSAVEALRIHIHVAAEPRIIRDELAFNRHEAAIEARDRRACAKPSQGRLLDAVIHALDHPDDRSLKRCFFVDAPGGTGKTFCFNMLLAYVRQSNDIALAVASSGIAALLLNLGRTFHSRFKASLTPKDGDSLRIKGQSADAKLVKRCKLIIWDEAGMQHRWQLEALDRTLKEIMKTVDPTLEHVPFGGKVVVLGSDFRQTLPIIKRASRAQTVDATLHRSPCWEHFRILALTDNMRVENAIASASADREVLHNFAEWMLQIGEGREPTVDDEERDDVIALPAELCLPPTANGEIDTAALVERVFPNLAEHCTNTETVGDWLSERAILAPRNTSVDELNLQVLESFPGAAVSCFSADTLTDDDADADVSIPIEYLNSQRTSGMPEHEFIFKRNMPIMLLRNLNPAEGLCNGTRLLALQLRSNGRLLEAKIISGTHKGRLVLLPRIDLTPEEGAFPFKWKRRQFPVRAAFVMTINKSQGQSLRCVGIYLALPCFSHGQLYVAISRVGHPDHLCFALLPDAATGEFRTRNVVFKDALTCGMEHNVRCEPCCDAERLEFEDDDAFEAVAVAHPRPPTPGMDMEDVDSDSEDESSHP